MPWVLIITKPNHEAIASENLRRQQYQHYWPRFMEDRPKKAPVVRPLFPRYMFVLIATIWSPLLSTRGVTSLLMGEGGPQIVAEHEIEKLRKREGSNGLVLLDRQDAFAPGAEVRANDGPLKDTTLIYQGMAARDRVTVLFNAMGRMIRTEIEEKLLVAA